MAVFATIGPAGVPVTTSIFPYITRPGTPAADCLFWLNMIEHILDILTPKSTFDPLVTHVCFCQFWQIFTLWSCAQQTPSISKHWALNKTYQTSRDHTPENSKPSNLKHPMTIRFVSRRQPQQPRRPRRILGARGWMPLHVAARGGHAAVVEQLISAGATVDAANDDGRGPGRVFESFWEWLWRGDGRGSYIGRWFSCCALGCWMVFVLVEWYSYSLFKDPLLWWDGPLEIRVKEMRWNE